MPIAVAAAAGLNGEQVANPVTFDVWTFAFQAINILIVLFVLYRFMFRPVGRMIAQRQEFVTESVAQARSAREEADRLISEYQARLRDAHREAQEIVEKATRAAEERHEAIVAEAQADAARQLERARQEIRAEREQAVATIRQEVTGLVIAAAGKVIGRTIDGTDQRRLVQEFVQKVGPLG